MIQGATQKFRGWANNKKIYTLQPNQKPIFPTSRSTFYLACLIIKRRLSGKIYNSNYQSPPLMKRSPTGAENKKKCHHLETKVRSVFLYCILNQNSTG